ncbi:MAG: SMP-30/gluconolactonase/LRE family protein [Lewinellaceae bacterium]|nr:SMP-30/gluconolactonase/LRE family protein [Lewinellaceae bacterium]
MIRQRLIRYVVFLFVIGLAYLLLAPLPVDPASWTPPKSPGYSGNYQVNNRLAGMEILFAGKCPQCEDVAIDGRGRIYGGRGDGQLVRLTEQEEYFLVKNPERPGRPLGLELDFQGNLLVADAYLGLLSVDSLGKVTPLATSHGGRDFAFTDDLEIDTAGIIYFSDASDKFSVEHYTYDLIEHQPNGRLLAYNPENKQTTLLLDSLYFANGVAVSHDNQFVLVNETGAYRVTRYWIRGPKAGTSEIFIDNLPGFPDGISRGSDGIFWLTLLSPRNALVDKLMPYPFFRKALLRLPESLKPAPERYPCVLGLDSAGKVVYNLQDPAAPFAQISSVQEANGYLYFASLFENGVGRISLAAVRGK